MTKELEFKDLNILPGTKFDLRSEQYSALKGTSVFMGFLHQRGIIVSTPMSNGKPIACKPDSSVTIRLFINHLNCACAFRTNIHYVSVLPYPHLFLDIPDEIEVGEVRNSMRANVQLDALIKTELVPQAQSVVIENLSTDGARIQTDEFLGIAGNKINMTTCINLLGAEHKVKISGMIRSCPDGTKKEGKNDVYGIQFTRLDDTNKLIIYAYVMSKIIH